MASKRHSPAPRRTARQLERLMDRAFNFLDAHPGSTMEGLAHGLRMKTRELELPIRKLRAAKEIKRRGRTRATQYSVR